MRKIFIMSAIVVIHSAYAMNDAPSVTDVLINLRIRQMLTHIVREEYTDFGGELHYLPREWTTSDIRVAVAKEPGNIKMINKIHGTSFGEPEKGTLRGVILERTESLQRGKVLGRWRAAHLDAHTQCRGDVSREVVCETRIKKEEFLAALQAFENRRKESE